MEEDLHEPLLPSRVGFPETAVSFSLEETFDVAQPSLESSPTRSRTPPGGNADQGGLSLPSCWSPFLGFFSKDWLSVEFSSDGHKGFEWIATKGCIPEETPLFYFEVTSIRCPKKCTMVIGFVDSNAMTQPRYTEPKNLAMAYWCYVSLTPTDATQEKGDVFGCVLDREDGSICLTKNGAFLEKKFNKVNPGRLWPAIGLRSACEVRANFGDSQFSFDINKWGNGQWRHIPGMNFDSGFPNHVHSLKSFACMLSENGFQANLDSGGKVKANFSIPTELSSYQFEVIIVESIHRGKCEIGFMVLNSNSTTSVFSRTFLAKKGDVLGVGLNRETQTLIFTVNGEEIGVGHLVGVSDGLNIWPYFEALDPIKVWSDFCYPRGVHSCRSLSLDQPPINIKSFRGSSFPDDIPEISPLLHHKSNAVLHSVELRFPQEPHQKCRKLVLLSPSTHYTITKSLPPTGYPSSTHQIQIWQTMTGKRIGHVPILPETLIKDSGVPEGRPLRVNCVEWILEGEVLLMLVSWRTDAWVVAWNVSRQEVEWKLEVGLDAICSADGTLDKEVVCIRKGPHLSGGILLYSLQNRPNSNRFLKALKPTERGLKNVACFPGGEVDAIDQNDLWDLKTIARQISPDQSSLLAGAYLYPLDDRKPHTLIKALPFRAMHHLATWSSDSLFAASWRARQNSIFVLDIETCRSDALAGLPVECTRLISPCDMVLAEKPWVILLRKKGESLRVAASIQSPGKDSHIGCIWDVKTGNPIIRVDLGETPRPYEASWWVVKTPSEFAVIDKFSGLEIGRSRYDPSKLNFWPNENFPAVTRDLEETPGPASLVIWTVGGAFSKDDSTARTVSFEAEGDTTMCRISPDGSKIGVAVLGRESSITFRRESSIQIWDLVGRMTFKIPLVRLDVGLTPEIRYIEDPEGGSKTHTGLWGCKFKQICSHFDFSGDGRRLVTWDVSTSVCLWEIGGGRVHHLKELGKVQGVRSQSEYMWGQDGLCFMNLDGGAAGGGEGVALLGTMGITRFDGAGSRTDTHPEKAVEFARFTHGRRRALLFLAQENQSTLDTLVESWDLLELQVLQRGKLSELMNLGPAERLRSETDMGEVLDPEALLELANAHDGLSRKAVVVWPVGCASPILFGRDPRKKVKPQDPDYAIPGAFNWHQRASEAYVGAVVQRSDHRALKQLTHSFNVFAGIGDGSRIAWVQRKLRARTFTVCVSLTYGGSEIPTWYEELLDLDDAAIRNQLTSKIREGHGCGLINQPVFANGRSILLESVSRGHAKIVEQIVQVALTEGIPAMFLPWWTLDDGENENLSALQMAVDLGFPQIAKILIKYVLAAGPSEECQNGTVMSRILTKFLQRHPTGADFRSVFHNTITSEAFCHHLGDVHVPNDLFSTETYLVGLHPHCGVLPWQTDGLLGLQREIHEKLAHYGDEKYANAVKIDAKALVIPTANFVTAGPECVLRHLQVVTPNEDVFGSFAIDALVRHKWENGCKRHAILEFFAYMCLLFSFTVYSMAVGSRCFDPRNADAFCETRTVAKLFLVVSGAIASLHLIEEVGQLCKYINAIDPRDGATESQKLRSRTSGFIRYVFESKWNALEFATYVLVAGVIPALHWHRPQELHVVVAITNIALWWKTLYYMQIFSPTAPLVIAIFRIMNDMLSLVLLGSIVLFGFGLAYFVLLHPEPGEEIDMRFGTMLRSIYSVFTMLLGLFDLSVFEELEKSGGIATLMFVVFVLGMVVVLLNLLIAIMSDSFNRIRQVEDSAFIQAKARIIEDVETSIFYARREFPPYMHILIPQHEGGGGASSSRDPRDRQLPAPHSRKAADDCIRSIEGQMGCLHDRLDEVEARIERMELKQDEVLTALQHLTEKNKPQSQGE
ncbi:hypothetical protein BSKO_13405 [Bryopsis sp. KO-2023]|nr:hypothetical protein BSKO_13405 [Bryopsis sp. KO-2023]